MEFWKAAGQLVAQWFRWAFVKLQLGDFSFSIWQMFLFFFFLSFFLFLLGVSVKEDMQVEKGIRMHKKYQARIKEVK